jgi:hypothetical protein
MSEGSERFSPAWLKSLSETGKWDEPAWWRESDYLARSPWTGPELEAAFEALRRIYPPRISKKILREQPRVAHLLLDPFAPHVSGLVSLGLDAAFVEAWRYPRLLKRLHHDDQFDGARFELALLAAFRIAELPFRYEPLPKAKGQPDPDFEISFENNHLLLDAKSAGLGERIRENKKWFESLCMGLLHGAPRHKGELTPTFQQLQDCDEGRRWIRAHIQELRQRTAQALLAAGQAESYPVEEAITIDGKELVRLQILGPAGSSGGSSFVGVPHNTQAEAVRLVKNLVEGAASQIPADRIGGAIIEVDEMLAPTPIVREVERWFSEEGSSYPQVVFVLIAIYALLDDNLFKVAVPVWRAHAPFAEHANLLAERISHGLSWQALRTAEWKESRGSSSTHIGTLHLENATISLSVEPPSEHSTVAEATLSDKPAHDEG